MLGFFYVNEPGPLNYYCTTRLKFADWLTPEAEVAVAVTTNVPVGVPGIVTGVGCRAILTYFF
jgi:hypothetical protein